jgi:murein DD-endopeptidase MepM/ murein hydrolase activator NlpD
MSVFVRSRLLLLVLLLIGPPLLTNADAAGPPFGLPMAEEPGPSTWYVSQWYGNTVWAARNGHDLYPRGQGIHFGVDFAAPCGTDVIAIGDGVVHAVDGPYGAPPHNAVIEHDNGCFSLYGHLQVRSSLSPGTPISKGDRVGQVGDPAGDECVRAPHLHLEIRRAGMTEAVNPVPLIDADWRLLTIGAQTEGTQFAVDFANPGRWQTIHDQHDIRFGGPRLNDYQRGWTVR